MTRYYYDLHVHSCLSPCADDDMTPNNIAGMAAIKGLNIVALTDHNSCKNCPAFFDACRRYGIIPVAGMELSTAEDIHIVCLFEQLETAMQFDSELQAHLTDIENRPDIFGNQLVLDKNDEVVSSENKLLISATDLPIADALCLARSFGAHTHPAHIDREANGILATLGDIPGEYEFACVEFSEKCRMEEIRQRCAAVKNSAYVVSSDAHRLWNISEAENYVELDDEPYSSSLVRKRLLEHLSGRH